MTDLHESGLWWLPGQHETPVAGTLVSAVDAHARLDLIGAFQGMEAMGASHTPDIVLGVAGGHFITLYHCALSGSRIQAPGLHTESYTAEFVLKGAHFATPEDIVFETMTTEYDALFEWSGMSGFKVEFSRNDEGHLLHIGAEYRFPPEQVFPVNGATLSLVPRTAMSGGPLERAVELRQEISLRITPDVALRIDDYLTRYLHDASNFLTLAVGKPVRTTAMKGTLRASDSRDPLRPTTVSVSFLGRDRHVTGEKRHWDMLFTLPSLGSEAGQAIRRWYDRADALRAIYDLYFSTLFQRGAYIHQRFLSLAQALESYHRRTTTAQHAPPDLFAQLHRLLIATVDSPAIPLSKAARSAFRHKLQYLNEVSLRRRLTDLLAARSSLAGLLIRDHPRFVKRVVNTRNYYTHYDTASEESAVSEDDLHFLSDQMQFLLELCLLSELGLSTETIDRLITHHQRYLQQRSSLAAFDAVP